MESLPSTIRSGAGPERGAPFCGYDRTGASRGDAKLSRKLAPRGLALACACSAGSEAAWEFFVGQFRQELYRAARAITGGASAGDADARELADSLYADLYGLRESEGRRKSLFDYFHGRSKLGTWLRAILAQRHVDAIRRARKLEPLEDETGRERSEIMERAAADAPTGSGTSRTAVSDPPDPDRARYCSLLQAALTGALASLEPRDRLRLAYYYSDERTLAEIGRLLGEHEATVSRKLERDAPRPSRTGGAPNCATAKS